MLTDAEIKTAIAPLFGTSDALNFAMKTSSDEYRAIIAAYQAKLLAGVEMPEPVGRTMRYIGNDDYARKHSYCARTYDELSKGMYSDTWQDLEQLYTKDQLQQYAAAAAAQAREKALEDAGRAVRARWPNTRYAEPIEQLKVKV